MPIATLTPSIVWKHFATLCAIPHASKQEAALRDTFAAWAAQHGWPYEVDAAGNLLIRKPAAPGCAAAPTLALQAHLDMVCQAASGVQHDFLHSPIYATLEDGWLRADSTTLGADNGLGVALALAALEDDTLAHGPLEVLLTVDEEAGMGGAQGLQPNWLNARLMLNLDTEEWGEFYLGCAGGADVNVSAQLDTVPVPADYQLYTLHIGGLRGGHSGCDIHRQRGNANRLLAQALQALSTELAGTLGLLCLDGGNARNALPREAHAQIALPARAERSARRCLATLHAAWCSALVGEDGERLISWSLEPTAAGANTAAQALTPSAQAALLDALCNTPYGVSAMSPDFVGVVAASNNLGTLSLSQGQLTANLMVRALHDDQTRALAEEIAAVFRAAGLVVQIDGEYPGWAPNPASPLLALCQQVFVQTFADEATVQVIHAGLECGIIGAKYPGLDTVSFGPTIRGAHAPGERVEIASVQRCWTLLRALLTEVGARR